MIFFYLVQIKIYNWQGFPLKPVAGGNPPFAVASSAGFFTDKNINLKRNKYLFQMFTGSQETYCRGHDKQGMKSQCLPWAKYSSHEFRSLIGCLFKVRMYRFFLKITRETFRWSLKDNNREVPMVINSWVFLKLIKRKDNQIG